MLAQFAIQARLIFRQLWPFLRSHKKLGLISFIIITSAIITSWFVFAPFAQAGLLSDVGETIGKAFAELLFLLAGFCIKLTFFVLKFIIEVAGYNGFIDSPAVTVGWVMIRDLTNMFFVVVLLMIAFGTILGLDHYEWKHMLVKLVTAAVLVNFSRLICGLIIDVAQIVMVTFLNGIAATASGNLVNMFQVDKIFKLGNGENFTGDTPSIFLASVAAIMFSVTMLITMVAFLFIIVARMAMLWVLIVVSPFAFVLNVLHQTEHFAGEWWGKFNSNVVSGPVIAFFLWLSFVTVGSGNIHDDIVKHNSLKQGQLLQESAAPAEEQTGITEVMSWENMGNFIIAIAILMAGAKMAEELGVAGAHMMGSASELGKKAAMYASGFQAAKWAAPRIGKGLYYGSAMVPGLNAIHPERWKQRASRLKSRASQWYAGRMIKGTLKASKIAEALKVDSKTGKFMKEGSEQKRDKDGKLMFDNKGKPIMEKIEQGGFGSSDWFKRTVARFRLETGVGFGDFHKAITEDEEDAAEKKNEQREHYVSTSSQEVGFRKQKAKEELRTLEHTGHDISEGKEANMDERREEIMHALEHRDHDIKEVKDNKSLSDKEKAEKIKKIGEHADDELRKLGLSSGEIDQSEALYKRFQKSMTSKAQAEVVGGLVKAQHDIESAKALKKFLKKEKEGGEDYEQRTATIQAQTQQIKDELAAKKQIEELEAIRRLLEGAGKEAQERIAAKKAKAENINEALELQKNKQTLLARAKEYKDNRELLRAGLSEQQAHSLELNKMKEIFKSASIGANERANIAAQIVAEMTSVRKNSSLNSDEKLDRLRSLVRQKDSLNDLNSTLGAYDAKREEEEELRTLEWNEGLNSQNIARRFLSRKIGKVVKKGEEKAALDEYKTIVGAEEFENRMRQLGAHAKDQIAMGNASAIVFNESPQLSAGKLTGLTNYTPMLSSSADTVAAYFRAYNKGGDFAPSKMREAVGTRRLSSDSGGGSTLTSISETEAELNAELLGSYDTRAVSTMGNTRPFIGDLDASEIDKASLAEQLSALAKRAKDGDAFIELCTKKLKTILAKHKIQEDELKDLFKSATS